MIPDTADRGEAPEGGRHARRRRPGGGGLRRAALAAACLSSPVGLPACDTLEPCRITRVEAGNQPVRPAAAKSWCTSLCDAHGMEYGRVFGDGTADEETFTCYCCR